MPDAVIRYRESRSYASHADEFRTGKTSPLTLLDEGLARIERREAAVRAFVALDIEAARAEAARSAARWRNGTPLSPLDGMAVAVKDIIETDDLPTGQGSPLWSGFRSQRDAASVQGLRMAGAIVLGKSTTTEFASTELFASTTNPHDAQRTPGGSSSGSAAAVGAGFVPLALGSQVVGSTLRPASFCGCVGFKPSQGALNRGGSYDYLSHSCVGVLGGALEDVWLSARAIASHVGGDPGHAGLAGPTEWPPERAPKRLVLLETAGWQRAGAGAQRALQTAAAKFEALGVEIVTRRHAADVERFEQVLASGLLELGNAIIAWESRWPLESYARRGGSGLSRGALKRLDDARAMTPDDYAAALARRAELREAFGALIASYDGAMTLSAPGAAPRGFASTGDPVFNVQASLIGAPALSLPMLSDEDMPLGLQLIGAPGQDATLFSLARWVARETAGDEARAGN